MAIENSDFYPYMQNRESSWLKFNQRVLFEANRAKSPLLERLKYISIFTSNLGEFFMVRVGTLTDYAQFDKSYFDNKTGKTAQEQLDEIFESVLPLYAVRCEAYNTVMGELADIGIKLHKPEDLDPEQQKVLRKYFFHNVAPLLSPQIIDSRHPFPHLANLQLHIAVTLEKKKGVLYGIIAIPTEMNRLVSFGVDGEYVLLEDLILYFTDDIFSIYKVLEKNIIAVTRNADIDTEDDFLDENIDYRAHMKNILKKRQRLSPVRLEFQMPAQQGIFNYLTEKLSLRPEQVFIANAPLDLSFCFTLDKDLSAEKKQELLWQPHIPSEALYEQMRGKMLKHFDDGEDILLSYPYDSIMPFLSLIHEASSDPSVLSIKITLYRIDMHSRLAESLIQAVENGKEVVILMELRARFDEKNNIEWASRLEESGCRIIYGLQRFKVHSKVCLITRKTADKINFITLIGTGNFNEKTAKLYTDLAVLTTHQEIGLDASNFFNNLLLGNLEGHYEHLWVAPNSFKYNLMSCINEERQKAIKGQEGRIIFKCNSLTDKDVIETLAKASCDGVKVSLIVRGICCIIPQLEDFTANITVISIVGKFLEHSRIFTFGTGAAAKVYISSADLMTRNTERRVEVAAPIYNQELKRKVLKMLDLELRDNTHAWDLNSEGKYILRKPEKNQPIINSQEILTFQAQQATGKKVDAKPSRNVFQSALGKLKNSFRKKDTI